MGNLYAVYCHLRRRLTAAEALRQARVILATQPGIYRTLLLGYRSVRLPDGSTLA